MPQAYKETSNSIFQAHSTQVRTHHILFHFFFAVDNNLPEVIVQNFLANENFILQIFGQFLDGAGVIVCPFDIIVP